VGARLVERTFDDGVRLLASPSEGIGFGPDLKLSFSFHIEPIVEDGMWRLATRRYDFTLTRSTRPIEIVFAWHWHPASKQSRITYPHVHVPSASRFNTRHIPTGRVSLEDIILFGFDDLGVNQAHPDAHKTVTEVRDRHKKYQTWH